MGLHVTTVGFSFGALGIGLLDQVGTDAVGLGELGPKPLNLFGAGHIRLLSERGGILDLGLQRKSALLPPGGLVLPLLLATAARCSAAGPACFCSSA